MLHILAKCKRPIGDCVKDTSDRLPIYIKPTLTITLTLMPICR